MVVHRPTSYVQPLVIGRTYETRLFHVCLTRTLWHANCTDFVAVSPYYIRVYGLCVLRRSKHV